MLPCGCFVKDNHGNNNFDTLTRPRAFHARRRWAIGWGACELVQDCRRTIRDRTDPHAERDAAAQRNDGQYCWAETSSPCNSSNRVAPLVIGAAPEPGPVNLPGQPQTTSSVLCPAHDHLDLAAAHLDMIGMRDPRRPSHVPRNATGNHLEPVSHCIVCISCHGAVDNSSCSVLITQLRS